MRIIDADALEKKLNERYDYLLNENGPYDHFTDGYEEAVSTVEDFLTVDAEVVVRCKDCYQSVVIGNVLHCTYWGKDTDENGYCHEGG